MRRYGSFDNWLYRWDMMLIFKVDTLATVRSLERIADNRFYEFIYD